MKRDVPFSPSLRWWSSLPLHGTLPYSSVTCRPPIEISLVVAAACSSTLLEKGTVFRGVKYQHFLTGVAESP